jgi:hypothetical protein
MTDTYTITYTARTITYTLNGTDATTGLLIRYLGDQGFGLAPLRRITTRGPLQDGDSDIDFRLEPRVLQIPLMVVNTSATAPKYQHYEIREKLLSIFRPGDNAFITVTRSDGVTTKTRRINVRVLGGMSFDVDPDTYHVRTVVQLRADDPTWYDPTTSTYTVAGSTITVGGVTNTIVTNGNWKSFPIVRFNGPISNPTFQYTPVVGLPIEGVTINTSITFGYIEVNLSYGSKTVRYINGPLITDYIQFVSASSALATWSLYSGSTSVQVSGGSTTSSSDVVFTWNDRFTGI